MRVLKCSSVLPETKFWLTFQPALSSWNSLFLFLSLSLSRTHTPYIYNIYPFELHCLSTGDLRWCPISRDWSPCQFLRSLDNHQGAARRKANRWWNAQNPKLWTKSTENRCTSGKINFVTASAPREPGRHVPVTWWQRSTYGAII